MDSLIPFRQVTGFVAFIALASAGGVSRAAPVVFAFTGEVTQVNDPDGVLSGGVIVGDALVGTYTFESTTANNAFPSTNVGRYLGALTNLSAQLGATTFAGPVDGGQGINLLNDFGISPEVVDNYTAASGILLGGHSLRFSLDLQDPTATAFSGSQLPLTPPPLDAFDPSRLHFDVQLWTSPSQFTDLVIGRVESLTLVPEPGVLGLLTIGALTMLKRRGRE